MIQLATEHEHRAMRFYSSDGPVAALRPKLVVEYTPRCGDTPTQFTDVAYVGAPACSDTDYSTIDNCYNACNPPTPTITRPTSQLARDLTDDVVTIDPEYKDSGAPGSTVVLPFQRSTNDGRIFISVNGVAR